MSLDIYNNLGTSSCFLDDKKLFIAYLKIIEKIQLKLFIEMTRKQKHYNFSISLYK